MNGESHIVKRASTKLFRNIKSHNRIWYHILFLIIYFFIKKYDLECSTFANGDL